MTTALIIIRTPERLLSQARCIELSWSAAAEAAPAAQAAQLSAGSRK